MPTKVRPYLPLVLLVVAGLAVRAYTMAAYSTVVTDYYTGDAGRYIRVGYAGLFEDEWQPAGYAAFLAGIRAITDVLSVTIGVQHLLGVATALLLYATVRRAGGSRPVALFPPAVVLLSGDHVFLEHAFLMEPLWMALLVAALYAATRGAVGPDLRWTALASVLLGLSVVVRNVGLLLPAILAVWMLWVTPNPFRERLRAGVVAVAPAALVVGGYVLLATSLGSYSGMGEMSGWSLYTRVAQFADCTRFFPPAGTAGLCEDRPTEERPGPYFYYWSQEAPARTALPAMSPAEDDEAGAFARAAIRHQPLEYGLTVTKDVVRYFDPDAGFDRELSGSPPEAMSFRSASPDPANTQAFAETVRAKYRGLDPTPDAGSAVLETYHSVLRLSGLGLLVLFVLTAVGVIRGAKRTRALCLLCAASASVILLVPAAVASYDSRYTVPPAMLLSVSAALGAAALVARRQPEGAVVARGMADRHPGAVAAEPRTATTHLAR